MHDHLLDRQTDVCIIIHYWPVILSRDCLMLVIRLSVHRQNKQIGVRLGAANGTGRRGTNWFAVTIPFTSIPYYRIPYSILFLRSVLYIQKNNRSNRDCQARSPEVRRAEPERTLAAAIPGSDWLRAVPTRRWMQGLCMLMPVSAPSYASPKRVGAGDKKGSAVRF